jgi:dTDP-4-amino-4,6-dideoxygalactose transaminase
MSDVVTGVPLLDLKAQYVGMRDEIRAAMDEVCDAQYFILGPKVTEFEAHVAEYCGTADAVGVSSGSDALLVSLMALDIGPGDAVLTTPYTFFATVGAIVRLGAVPVFADIDATSFNMDADSARGVAESMAEKHPGLKLKAMVPVHLYGQSANMDALMQLAKDFNLAVVEDAAQAIGVEYKTESGVKRVGSIGDVGCFSFFPSKNLGGFGDGGIVTTNNRELAEKIRQLRNHGSEPKYYHKLVGGNFRLDALQAAVLDIKLGHLDSWHAKRRQNADFYEKLFEGSAVETPQAVYRETGITNYHIYNQFVVRVPNRDAVKQALLDANIGCDIYYPVPLHLQECFADLGYSAGDFPVSEKAAAETLALPIYPELTESMQEYVAKTLIAAVGESN